MKKKYDIYNIIGRASVGRGIADPEREFIIEVLRQRTDVAVTEELRAELRRLFPEEHDAAVMTWWNIKVPVVELVQARTAEEATDILIRRLMEAGFPTEYAEDQIADIRDDAMVSAGGLDVLDGMFSHE
jgi:hypothetical protein